MSNLNSTKAFLQKALIETPQDFALSEVRNFINAALMKIEAVEKKRENREIAAENRKETRSNSAFDPFKVIKAIDEMISVEKAKINEINKRRLKKDGEDELQELLD